MARKQQPDTTVSTGQAEKLAEHKIAALHAVFKYVEQTRVTQLPWKRQSDQLDHLKMLISYRMAHGSIIAKKKHSKAPIAMERSYTPSGLRNMVQTTLEQHAKMGKNAFNDLFKHGIAAVPEEFKKAINYTSDEESVPTGTTRLQPENSDQTSNATRTLKASESQKLAGSLEGLTEMSQGRNNDETIMGHLSRDVNSRKRKASESRVDRNPKTSFRSPETAASLTAHTNQKSDSSAETRQEIDKARDYLQESRVDPKVDPQPETTAEESVDQRNELDISERSLVPSRLPNWRTAGDQQVSIAPKEVAACLERVESLVTSLAHKLVPHEVRADFVRRPGTHLLRLYERLFGLGQWSERILWLYESVRFDAAEMLSSLLGSWLYMNVLDRPSPWRIERRDPMLQSPWWSEFEKVLWEQGIDFDSALNRSAYALLANSTFQDRILPSHVANLTSDLSSSILEQVGFFWPPEGEDQHKRPHPPLMQWYEDLARIVRECVILKAKMETTSWCLQWQWLWPRRDADFVRGHMERRTDAKELNKVGVTLFPGIISPQSSGVSNIVSPAKVLAYDGSKYRKQEQHGVAEISRLVGGGSAVPDVSRV